MELKILSLNFCILIMIIYRSNQEISQPVEKEKSSSNDQSVFVDLIKTVLAKQSKSQAVKIKFKGDTEQSSDTSFQDEKIDVERQELEKNEDEDFEYGDYGGHDSDAISYNDLRFLLAGHLRAAEVPSPPSNVTFSNATFSNATFSNTSSGNVSFDGNETEFEAREPFELPIRKNYILSVTIPVFLGLLGVVVLIYILFRFPNKIVNILSDEPFLTWDEYYEQEMQKQGLMIEGGYCLCEDKLMGLLTETGIKLPKNSDSIKEEEDTVQSGTDYDDEEDEEDEEDEDEDDDPRPSRRFISNKK